MYIISTNFFYKKFLKLILDYKFVLGSIWKTNHQICELVTPQNTTCFDTWKIHTMFYKLIK